MASGLPCLASLTGGVPEVAGDAALLVPPSSPSALAEALARLGTSDQLRARLGRAARARVEACFGLRDAAERLAALYREVARGGAGA
jgi:glycosyltransferase involved in cell wall biosynthesis